MTLSLPVIPPNERPDLCGPCGGLCCKRSPGISLPGDWADASGNLDEKRIEDALAKGDWVVERWDEELVVRPAALSEIGWVQIDAAPEGILARMYYSGAGRCALLGENGCKLTFAERPSQCRMSVPNQSRHCLPADGIGFQKDSDFQKAWRPHRDALERCSSKAWARA